MLLHLNRPVRSIPSHPNSPDVSEVPLILPQRQPSLLFPSNAIRIKPGAENIHKGDHRGSQSPASSNDPRIRLYRRFPPFEHVRHHACPSDQHRHNSSHKSRPFGQLGKVFFISFTIDLLPRCEMERRKLLSSTKRSQYQQVPFLSLPQLPVVHDQQETIPASDESPQFPGPLLSSRKTPPPLHHPACPIIQDKTASPRPPPPVEEPPPSVARQEEPLTTFCTDASHSGWGGVYPLGLSASGRWSPEDKLLRINILECFAVLKSLLTLPPPDQSSSALTAQSSYP